VVGLLVAQCGVSLAPKFFASDVFLVLVCFVVLQVMIKGTW
jgi:hypothetical protein